MATTPVSARSGSLKTVLPSIAKDFEAIKIGFTKLVKLKKEEGLIRSSDVSRQRQVSYKEKFSKVILNKIDPKKKTLAEHTKGFFSVLKSIAGVLGSVFLFLGAVGIGKMIMSSDAGKFLGKFLATVFSSLIVLVKSSIDIVKSLFQDNEVKSTFFKTVSSIFKLIGDGLLVGFQIFKTLISDREIVEGILNTIKNVFSAVFASAVVLASIVAEVFSQNTESIRNGIVSVITKIIDVLVPLLNIGSGVFKDLVNNESFLGSLKNIVRGIGELLVSIWNINYIDPNTGEEKSVAGEIVKTIAEIGVAYAAFLALKLKLIEAGAALGAKGGEGIIEPSIEEEPKRTPSSVPGGRIPKGGGRKGPSLEKIAAARETKASKMERLKYVLEKKWRQIGLLAEKFRYSKIGQSKIIDLTIRLLYRLGIKIGQSRVYLIISSLVAGAVASGTGIATPIGLLILAANLYFAYDIIMVLLENIDILNKDIEDEEKKSEDATKGTAPTQSQLNLEGSKIGAGYAEAAKSPPSKTPTPTSTPGMAPAPTAPSPIAQSAGVEEMKGKVIGAGTAAAAAEATAALQANMKKGDVSAKQHEPGTDVLAQKLPGLIPGFNRFTAFDDAFHNKVSPGSKHASGLALDFTVNGGSAEYAKAAEAVRKHLSSVGLNSGDVKVIDEMNNPSSKATGPHIHVQFQSKEAADKYRGLFPDMPLTAFAKDAAPKEGTPFTLPTPSATLAGVDQQKEEKQKSLASLMMDDLTGSLAMMDQITGGKLGLASNDMKSMLRGLEDEMNRGTNFFNNSINIATQNIKNDSGAPSTIQQTNQNILNTILNRQYA